MSNTVDREYVIGPEGKLLGDIFDGNPQPVVTRLEEARKIAVANSVASLPSERRQVVVDRYYGLTSREPVTLRVIAGSLNVSAQLISRDLARARRELRHPTRSWRLLQYIPLSAEQLGKAVFNADYPIDLVDNYPFIDQVKLGELGFSKGVLRALYWGTFYKRPSDETLKEFVNFSAKGLWYKVIDPARTEFIDEIKDRLNAFNKA